VDKCVGGGCDPSLTRANPERLTDEYRTRYKALSLYKNVQFSRPNY